MAHASADVAIVGAGIAGLAAAAALAAVGQRVTVLEKSRGLGGRMATRQGAEGPFDHGPPGVTAADPVFATLLDAAIAAGHAAPWPEAPARVLSGPTGPSGPADTVRGAVGVPGTSSLVRPLAAALPNGAIRLQCEAIALDRRTDGWHIATEGAGAVHAGTLILAAPAPQSARLLAAADLQQVAAPLATVAYRPMMTAMLALDRPMTPPDPLPLPLQKAIRQGDLPGRATAPERWVLHADATWSAAHADDDKPAIADALIAAFAGRGGTLPGERHRAGHRWRYALVTRPLGAPCLWHVDLGLGLCGDWCLGDAAEHAHRSGRALAAAMTAAMAG